MTRYTILTIMLGALSAGCNTGGGGGGGGGSGNGDGDDAPGQNDNANTSGADGDGGTSNDNAGSVNDNGGPSNDNSTDTNDNDDSGELPTSFRLDGVWDDNGRQVIIQQNGVEVVATYFSEYICDLETGPVPLGEEPAPGAMTQSTFADFRGTLNNGEEVLPGDTITGETTTCFFGEDAGIVLGELTLTVVDENTLSGEWTARDIGGSVTVTRLQ